MVDPVRPLSELPSILEHGAEALNVSRSALPGGPPVGLAAASRPGGCSDLGGPILGFSCARTVV